MEERDRDNFVKKKKLDFEFYVIAFYTQRTLSNLSVH